MDFEPTFFSTLQNPYAHYDALIAEHGPLFRSETMQAWLVFPYNDVKNLLNHPALSSRRPPMSTTRLTSPQLEGLKPIRKILGLWPLFMDGERHMTHRKRFAKAFLPKNLGGIAERISQRCDELFEKMSDKGSGDFVADFAVPLPVLIIQDILDLPDPSQVKSWSMHLARYLGTPNLSYEKILESTAAIQSMNQHLIEQIAELRQRPNKGLTSQLLEVYPDDDEQVAAIIMMLIFGGHETTTSLLSTGLLSFLRNPEQLAAFRDDPNLRKQAVDECLRYEPPGQFLGRRLLDDIEVRNNKLRAGEDVYLMIGAANHDGEVFEDPHQFNIHRPAGGHLSFGGGNHFCVGTHLARLEAKIAFEKLWQRFPKLKLEDDKIEWREDLLFRCPLQLKMSYH